MDLLNHYNYVISYRPGSRNSAVDTLSRKGELALENPIEEEPTTLFPLDRFREISTEIAELDDRELMDVMIAIIEEAISSDQEIQERIRTLLLHINELPNDVISHDGLAYHGDQIFVPDDNEIKAMIMRLYHNSPIVGHLGQQGTLELVQRMYWWKGQALYVRDYVKGCHTCAQHKHRNWKTPGTLQPLPTPTGPWEWTQSDHITGLLVSSSYDTIYVIMDRLTKMAHFIPTHTMANTDDLVQLHLKHVWKHHRVPQVHNTDWGTLFTADYT